MPPAVKSIAKSAAAILAATLVTFGLLVAVEFFSAIVHPFPAGFDGNIPEHVRRYLHWVLAAVVPMWSAIAALAVWLAARFGGRVAGVIIILLLTWAIEFNLSMLPYTLWFKIVMPAALALSCWLGYKYALRSPAPVCGPA